MNTTHGERGRSARTTIPSQVSVVNVGLPVFGEALRAQQARTVDVAWRIPAGGDDALVAALTQLYGPAASIVEEANREAVRRLDEAAPVP
jgi:hypothetical protein